MGLRWMKSNPKLPKYPNFVIKRANHSSLDANGVWQRSLALIVTRRCGFNTIYGECKRLHPHRNSNHIFSHFLSSCKFQGTFPSIHSKLLTCIFSYNPFFDLLMLYVKEKNSLEVKSDQGEIRKGIFVN